MAKQLTSRTPLALLGWAAFGVLIGRAWQHLRWDAPFRAFFWDENLLSGLLGALGYSWSDWLGSPAANEGVQWTIYAFGMLYLVTAIAVLLVLLRPPAPGKRLPAAGRQVFIRWPLRLASFSLFLLALLYWKEKFYQVGQLIEYSLQVGAPLFLLWALEGMSERRWWVVRVAIALTFVGHGLYALGFHPRPGYFLQMTMSGFSVSLETAQAILTLAGWLDMVAAVLLLLPQRHLARIGLYYCVVWGLMTTVARIWSNAELYGLESLLNRWVWESILRLPHFLVPLAVLWEWKSSHSE